MKRLLYLFLTSLILSFFSCDSQSINNNVNQYYSEDFVYENTINNMNMPYIIVSFNYSYEIDKSKISENATMDEVKEFVNNHRETTKDYFSQNNKKLFDNMSLELENEKVYISNFLNCIFIELDENKSNEYYDQLLIKIKSFDYVQSAYFE